MRFCQQAAFDATFASVGRVGAGFFLGKQKKLGGHDLLR